ncbi:hypothetical protein HDU91_001333, partial [Kappamyces sp. JEL0680]
MISEKTSCYDIICVGFGPAALSIAIACNSHKDKKVLFIEKQKEFGWQSGLMLEGSRMRISFLKDMVTQRDPTSPLSFLNFLKIKGRLESFTNLGTFHPFRAEYQEYLQWVASHFKNMVAYGETVLSVTPCKDAGVPDTVSVVSLTHSGEKVFRKARNIILACGGQPFIPAPFDQFPNDSRICHSSRYLKVVQSSIFQKSPEKILVLGSGQSSGEMFHDLISRFPDADVSLVFRSSSIKPVDDSSFVNEVFNRENIDSFYDMTDDNRDACLREYSNTNYSVLDPHLLEELYGIMYRQKQSGSNKYSILSSTSVTNVTKTADGKFDVEVKNSISGSSRVLSGIDCVFLGTGFDVHQSEKLLYPLFKEFGNVVSVQRDYQLVFDSSDTKPVNCKVYRVGCNEKTHGLSDTLLSNLAFRGDVIIESLFGPPKDDTESRELQPSGTLLFQKYFEGTKSCLSIHVASIALHLSHFHDWMNNERVNEFWKEAGTIEQHQRYLEAQLDSKHSLPLIASYDGEPFAYFEMYYADLDKI